MDKILVSYTEYDQLIDRVIDQVRQSGLQFDWVMGVSRGGLLLADALSRSFRLPMAVVAASSYGGQSGTQQGHMALSASVASVGEVKGRLLLADDLVDSGATLQALQNQLTSLLPQVQSVHTAVLWWKPSSCVTPHYYAERCVHDQWIVQPFERRDW